MDAIRQKLAADVISTRDLLKIASEMTARQTPRMTAACAHGDGIAVGCALERELAEARELIRIVAKHCGRDSPAYGSLKTSPADAVMTMVRAYLLVQDCERAEDDYELQIETLIARLVEIKAAQS